MKKNLFFISLCIGLIALDQVIKLLVKHFQPSFNVIPGFISVHFVKNPGISFGILSTQPILILIMTIALSALIGYAFIKADSNIEKFCWMLILVGAVGNIIDRLVWGYVIDYLDVNYFVCNLADIFIFVGAMLLLVDMVKRGVWKK